MPRSVKHGGKKVYKFKNLKNAAKAKKKSVTKKRNVVAACEQMAQEWDKTKTMKQNLDSMGLAYDANKTISFQTKKPGVIEIEEMDVEEIRAQGSVKDQKKKLAHKTVVEKDSAKSERVISALEEAIVEETKKQKVGQRHRLQPRDIEFCSHMIKTHGDDFEAMSRDSKNLFQESSGQIARKIRTFKNTSHYKDLIAEQNK